MRILAIALALGAVSLPVLAEAAEVKQFDVRPVILKSQDKSSATVGVEYDFKRTFEHDFSGESVIKFANIELEGKGTFAASPNDNPTDFVDAKMSGLFRYGDAESGSFLAGGFVKVEADQRLDNVQTAYGGRFKYAKVGLPGRTGDQLGFSFEIGEVDPGDDKLRKAALGVNSLKTYDRMAFEALYVLRVNSLVDTVELNYRRFQEIDAPARIRTAKLRVHELGTVRVNFKSPYFVSYSTGRLPFDLKNDETVAFGLRTNLEKLGSMLGAQ